MNAGGWEIGRVVRTLDRSILLMHVSQAHELSQRLVGSVAVISRLLGCRVGVCFVVVLCFGL